MCGRNAEFKYVKAGSTYRTTGLYKVKETRNLKIENYVQLT
jgi:cytidylate kinase